MVEKAQSRLRTIISYRCTFNNGCLVVSSTLAWLNVAQTAGGRRRGPRGLEAGVCQVFRLTVFHIPDPSRGSLSPAPPEVIADVYVAPTDRRYCWCNATGPTAALHTCTIFLFVEPCRSLGEKSPIQDRRTTSISSFLLSSPDSCRRLGITSKQLQMIAMFTFVML